MQIQLRHAPSFTVARCVLAPNEPLRVEGGAMLALCKPYDEKPASETLREVATTL